MKTSIVTLLKSGWNYSKEAVDSLIPCLGFVKPYLIVYFNLQALYYKL